MEQLILHLIGDYVTQSDWMAQNKTKRFAPAAAHAVAYSLPFLLLGPSWLAFAVILLTHFLIDRYQLARFVVWTKNVLGDPDFYRAWKTTTIRNMESPDEHIENAESNFGPVYDRYSMHTTGYPSEAPPWLAVWLLIAADNALHLAINHLSLRYL